MPINKSTSQVGSEVSDDELEDELNETQDKDQDSRSKNSGSGSGSNSNSDSDSNSDIKKELGGFDGSQLLLGLMSDPDVQAILSARREGKTTRVLLDEESETPEGTELISDDDELEDVDDDIKKVVSLLEKKLQPLTSKVKQLEQLAQNYERTTVDNQIKQVESKHKDFNKYRKEMAKLAREVGGLGVEELFLLAKHRAGALNLSEPSTHSERPTPTPRSRMGKDKKSATKLGRRGFRSTLANALDDLDFGGG